MSKSYTVKKGDTLSAISVRQYGLAAKWVQIKNANPQLIGRKTAIDGSPLIFPGDILIIPDDENVVIATNQGEPLVGNDTPAGQAYANVVLRVQGKEVPFLNFEKGLSFWTKVTGIFRKV